jgi:hypothetical protein
MTAMAKLLAALLETILVKTGIRWFFSGVTVDLPAYFVPNFRVVELSAAKSYGTRPRISSARR